MSIVSPPLSLRQQHDSDNNSNHHHNNTKENAITSGYNETHRTVDAGGGVGGAGMVTSGLTKVYTENQTTSSLPNSSSAENEQQVSLQTIIILLVMGVVVVVYCSKCLSSTHISHQQSDQGWSCSFLMMCGLWSTSAYTIYYILIDFVLFIAVTLAVLSKPAMNEIFLVLVSYVIIGTFLMIEICIFYTSGPRYAYAKVI